MQLLLFTPSLNQNVAAALNCQGSNSNSILVLPT
jgi:hypothetical protein